MNLTRLVLTAAMAFAAACLVIALVDLVLTPEDAFVRYYAMEGADGWATATPRVAALLRGTSNALSAVATRVVRAFDEDLDAPACRPS